MVSSSDLGLGKHIREGGAHPQSDATSLRVYIHRNPGHPSSITQVEALPFSALAAFPPRRVETQRIQVGRKGQGVPLAMAQCILGCAVFTRSFIGDRLRFSEGQRLRALVGGGGRRGGGRGGGGAAPSTEKQTADQEGRAAFFLFLASVSAQGPEH